jgi:molybdate transport system substrate-binding protein
LYPRPRSLAVAALIAGGLAAPPVRAEEVLVFAAASLTDALKDVGRLFEAATGHSVAFNFGGSSDLARQIKAGAPADVFFSADLARMDELERAGLVRAEDRVSLLSNVLVVIVPADSRAVVKAPSDLAGFRHLALANPESVPAGIYARRWLASLGLWERLKDRVVPTLDVRAALAAVEAENADAGIVYRTDAALSKRVRVALEVPRDQGPKITYALAALAGPGRAGTRALRAFLASPAALEVFHRHGFEIIAPR